MQIVADPDQHLYAKSFVPSRGTHTRVKARAIVLERAGTKYALVQADLGGIPYALTREVAERVRTAGIAEERILLSTTHTHASTGPIWPADNGGYALLGGDLFDPRIFELTAEGIAQAILRVDGGAARRDSASRRCSCVARRATARWSPSRTPAPGRTR